MVYKRTCNFFKCINPPEESFHFRSISILALIRLNCFPFQLADTWKDYYAFWGDCYIFVYSITDRRGFEEIINLKRQVENLKRSPVYGLLVGNKSDLLHDRQVPESEAIELADEIGCKFYELSAADWTQVSVIRDVFHDAVRLHRKSKVTRDIRARRTSSSMRFRQAIQKVITGKPSPKRPSTS